MSESVVKANAVSKIYKVYSRPADRFLELFGGKRRHHEFPALQDISFELAAGEGLGIVGENGAGKSTLLKILSGVTTQTSGEIEVRGKVASILELGSGFHPDFTGRQNIRLNAAMLGLDEAELEARIPEIIEFSELGDFIDQPVKVYSTGMSMRLGFAIATQVEPEVLVIDEALSVGDGYFQKKCMDRMTEFTNHGGTLLFCSHAMYYVSSFCQRALWMRKGRIERLGPAADVVREYENFLLEKGGEAIEVDPEDEGPVEVERPGVGRITDVVLSGGKPGESTEDPRVFRYGDPLELEITWQTADSRVPFHVAVGIDRIDSVQVASFSTWKEGGDPFEGRADYRLRLSLHELPIVKGEFTVFVYLMDERGLHPYDLRIVRRAFVVHGDEYEIGLTRISHRWVRADVEVG